MPSPFPGMDPYLEKHWEDVHGSVITYARDAIAPQLPGDLFARTEQRVYVDAGGFPMSIQRPDVHVVERPRWSETGRGSSARITAAEPILLDFQSDPVVESYIQIMDANGNSVVTGIEVVSPANKIDGAGRLAYLRKRDEFLASNANLVEIDLIRAGNWVTMLMPYLVPAPYHTAYRVSARRSTSGAKGELYPIALTDRLPVIRIPLRVDEPDVFLDLQRLIDRAYEFGGYDGTDYTKPCDPVLTGEEADWVDALLKAADRR